MACQQTPRTVADYFDERLSEAERQQLRHHVAGCRDCQSEIAALEPLVEGLGAWQELAVPAWDRAAARTTAGRPAAGKAAWFQRPVLPWAALAASCALALTFVLNLQLRGDAGSPGLASGPDAAPHALTGADIQRGEALQQLAEAFAARLAQVIIAEGGGELPDAQQVSVHGHYLLNQGLVIELRDSPPLPARELAPQSPSLAEQPRVQRPDAESRRETMALSLDPEEPARRTQPLQAQPLLPLLFARICSDSALAGALPSGQYLTLILPAAAGASRMHVVQAGDLQRCSSGQIDAAQLIDRAVSYGT